MRMIFLLMKTKPSHLRRALKNLVAMNLRLDPTDANRPQIKAALRALRKG